MDPLTTLETAIGADLLRAELLGGARPLVDERYQLQRFLGRGAAGLVVAAFDRRLDRAVALKLSLATGAGTGMLAEARALARLDHPHVVRVHDVDVVGAIFDRRPFRLWVVSMPLVRGVTARAWLATAERSPEEIMKVYLQAGEGLAAAHAQRFVHRDFKPDNVLVRVDGVAQVLDFGLAIATPTQTAPSEAAAWRQAAGTEPYMAPEALRGIATRASDQYSFALSLVEALTGEAVVPTRSRPEWLSRPLWRALRRATEADPKRRFANLPELLAALASAPIAPSRWPLRVFAASMLVAALVALVVTLGRTDAEGSWRTVLHGGRGAPPPVAASATSSTPAATPAAAPSASSTPTAAPAAVPAAAPAEATPDCTATPTSRDYVQALVGPKLFPGCYWLTVTHRGCAPTASLIRKTNEPSKNCADPGMPRFALGDGGALVIEGLRDDAPRLSLELDVEGGVATAALRKGVPHGTLTVTYPDRPAVKARINGAGELR